MSSHKHDTVHVPKTSVYIGMTSSLCWVAPKRRWLTNLRMTTVRQCWGINYTAINAPHYLALHCTVSSVHSFIKCL